VNRAQIVTAKVTFSNNFAWAQCEGPHTPDAIRQRDAIFRFSLTDNFDPSLNFPNIQKRYNIFSYLVYVSFKICSHWLLSKTKKNRVALSNRVRCVWTMNATANCDFSAPFERYATSCKSDTIFYSPMRTLRTNKPRAASYLYTHTMKVKKLVIRCMVISSPRRKIWQKNITNTKIAYIYRTYLLFVRFSVSKSAQLHSLSTKQNLMEMHSTHRSFISHSHQNSSIN
jgi:hypothetical protein